MIQDAVQILIINQELIIQVHVSLLIGVLATSAMLGYRKALGRKQSYCSRYMNLLKSWNKIPVPIRKIFGGCPFCCFFWVSMSSGCFYGGFLGGLIASWAYLALSALLDVR